MEIKILFEIEEGSKKIIGDFSKALMLLGNTTTIKNSSGTIVGKITNFTNNGNNEEEYVKQEMKNWQTNDVKDEIKTDETPAKIVESKEDSKSEVPVAAVPNLTLEQLRAGCVESSSLGKGSEVKKLLNEKYGVAKLDLLATENYDSFVEDLRALGVRI